MQMVPAAQLESELGGLGFDRIHGIKGSTYEDNSTIIVVPTRGMIHHRVVSAWQNLIAPMNQKRAFSYATGHEVGKAYDAVISSILMDPTLSKWKYIMTLEDDNLPPPDAHTKLLETIHAYNFDAVSGIYFTKGDFNMPMAYGDPDEYSLTGVLDFKPRDIRVALEKGQIMPVNGIAMGCALWKMDLFREIRAPWFVTVNEWIPEKGVALMTQDLNFCEKAKKAGKRFGVDCRCRVGHLNLDDGRVY